MSDRQHDEPSQVAIDLPEHSGVAPAGLVSKCPRPHRVLKRRESALLEFLQECEQNDHCFSAEEAARRSGYKLSSIKTYIGKKLEGYLVHATDRDTWRATGAIVCSEAEFALRMSQTADSPRAEQILGESSWRASVLDLIEDGLARGYALSSGEKARLLRLLG